MERVARGIFFGNKQDLENEMNDCVFEFGGIKCGRFRMISFVM